MHYVQAVLTAGKVAVSGVSGADNIGTQGLGLCASVEFRWQSVSRCGRARYWSGVSIDDSVSWRKSLTRDMGHASLYLFRVTWSD
jgi:hypothetical protein